MSDIVDPLDAALSTPTDGGTDPEGVQGQPAVDPPSAVQPEGQGQPDAQSGLYDLTTVPEEYRSHVEQIARDIDRNVNAKLREAAEFRKNFEPYQQINLHEYEPEGVKALLDFAGQLSEGGDAAREAIVNLAESLQIELGQQTPAAPAAGDDDPNRPLTRAEFQEWQNAQDQARREAVEMESLQREQIAGYQAEYAEIVAANGGKELEPADKQRLIQLARRFNPDHDQPIKAAWEFINSIAGQAETALVKGQPTPPAPAEPRGRAASTVEPVTDFDTAERLHRERNASAPNHA